jgi:uncharacterized membrane protein YeiH
VVIALVVALAGGVIRDLLIGVPPATFRDSRYLVAAGAAGIVSFFARPALERVDRGVTFFDALGLGVFCVTGASAALDHRLGPAQSIILGAITGVGCWQAGRRRACGSWERMGPTGTTIAGASGSGGHLPRRESMAG